MPKNIDHNQVQQLMLENARLVEVLPSAEYKQAHLPGAVNIPLQKLDRDTAARLISTIPDDKLVRKFRASDGKDKPCYGQVTVCWAQTDDQARRVAHECWPVAALPGKLMTELGTPEQFEAAAELVTKDAVASNLVCGPDLSKYIEKISQYVEAGFDHVYLHQVGPDQEGFFRFYEREILPQFH
ncbi:MAG: rhodanese-like domain-containing protein [Candidatus Binatia bacterium]